MTTTTTATPTINGKIILKLFLCIASKSLRKNFNLHSFLLHIFQKMSRKRVGLFEEIIQNLLNFCALCFLFKLNHLQRPSPLKSIKTGNFSTSQRKAYILSKLLRSVKYFLEFFELKLVNKLLKYKKEQAWNYNLGFQFMRKFYSHQ